MFDLLTLIERETGFTFRRTSNHDGGEYHAPCPWCGGEDRFMVWNHSSTPSYFCRQCGRSGGIVAFVRHYRNLSYEDAQKYLREQYGTTVVPVRRQPIRIQPPTMLEYVDFDECYRAGIEQAQQAMHSDKAGQEYFRSFGIDPIAAGIGSTDEGWVIPHRWYKADGTYLYKAAKIRAKKPSKKRPKYISIPMSKTGGVSDNFCVNAPDLSRVVEDSSPLFIVEAEKDYMLLRQLGYAAISYSPENRWNHFLPVIVGERPVVILADNDMAGKVRGRILSDALSAVPHIIATMPEDKQPTDAYQRAGEQYVRECLQSILERWLSKSAGEAISTGT